MMKPLSIYQRHSLNNFLLFLLIFIFPLTLLSIEKDQVIISEHIISQDTEDFDCHSSSLIEISPGILCAAWKSGSGRGKSNVDMKQNVGIWFSFFENDKWSKPRQIVEAPNSVCWSPVLAKYSTGEIILFYRIGNDPRHTVSMFKSSLDGGYSWSKYGPIEIPGKKLGCIEPALFSTNNKTLKMLCGDRSNRIGSEGWIWTAESSDKGKTWSELRKTDLPNPDSGIDKRIN